MMSPVRNIGLLAHVDAGKTTTAEQIFYASGKIRELGNVNKGTSTMDQDSIEKARGITIFTDQMEISWKGERINIIDTPGHVDFSAEMERSVKILDGAILIISAAEGIQSHTETIWEILKQEKIPTILFINKLDRVGVDLDKLKEDLKRVFGKVIAVDNEEVQESVVESNEELLEAYLMGDKLDDATYNNELVRLVGERSLVPVCYGCAREGKGIPELLEHIITRFTPYQSIEQDQSAYTYKVKIDDKIGRLSFVKVLSGVLQKRSRFYIGEQSYKVTALRKIQGSKYEIVDEVGPGELVAVSGLPLEVGHSLGNTSIEPIGTEPVLTSRIGCDEEVLTTVVEAFRIMDAEDPALCFNFDSTRKTMTIAIMGVIQMEIIKEKMRQRFDLEIDLDKPLVNYKESILEVSTGFCHFEPKKHFAEVEFEIRPLPKGSGIQYQSKVSVDDLPIQFQKIIQDHVEEGLYHGVLLGANVTDIEVSLIAGVHHLEHTHGGDFQIATVRALRQALEKNTCFLLEPYYQYKIVVDSTLSGKIMADLLQMKSQDEVLVTEGDKAILTGYVPISLAMEYPITLASRTGGRGMMSLRFAHYERCHDEEQVLADADNCIDYDDKQYNSVTILRHKKKMKKVVTQL